MKIAVTGKGGVGKSTVAAALALTLAQRGNRVLALDADPDANLAAALGMPKDLLDKIVPVTQQIALIEERTGAKVTEYGKVFKMNPDVADVADKLAVTHRGVELLELGAVQKGGGGCACPASAFAKALVADLVLLKNEALVLDMEAGIEHLGRATAHGVDAMLIVCEPGQRSVDCAESVTRMALDIGVKRLLYIGNKITGPEDEAFLAKALGKALCAAIPYRDSIRNADRLGVTALDSAGSALQEPIGAILQALEV